MLISYLLGTRMRALAAGEDAHGGTPADQLISGQAPLPPTAPQQPRSAP